MQASQDAASIRARLLEQRSALAADSKDAAESRAPVQLDQTSVGRLSRMDAMQAGFLSEALRREQMQELAAVDRALRTVDSDE